MEDGVDFCGTVDERHVLGRLGEHREVLDELAAVEGDVGGADLGPHEVELRQHVHEGGALPQVGERAGPPLTRAKVEGLGDAAAGGEMERFVLPEDHVVGKRGAGHDKRAGTLRERPLDELSRQASDARGFVDLGPMLGQQGQQTGAGEAHTDAAQQADSLVCDTALFGLGQPRRACLHGPGHLRGPLRRAPTLPCAAAVGRPRAAPRALFEGTMSS